MVAWFTNVVSWGLLVLLLANLPSFAWFLWRFWRWPTCVPDDQLAKTAAILCLRGADPTLERCIEGLLTQDHPRYHVVIIVDHHADPAWSLAQRVIQRHPTTSVRMEPLASPADSCSLKCS